MAIPEPRLTVGIEEEYLLVDRASRDLAAAPPDSMLAECEELLEGRVSPEFLRAQIEVGTRPATTVAEAGADLAHLRSTVARVSEAHGLAPIAASTHPFARWQDQQHVQKERYDALARDLQAVARRLLICGMHIHVEVGDDDLRIDLMNQMSYFLPHLLALTTSSPFWAGEDTGLSSYRLTVFDALPRTGLPDRYESFSEYERVVGQLVQGGLMEDATKLWWDLRPSARYPTLEMRIGDVCTRLDDAMAVAALTQCVISMLYRLRSNNQRWRVYPRILIHENRWRAQRYGVGDSLVDFGKGELLPYGELLDELLDMVREDAERLGCVAEIEHTRHIAVHGTSADRQRRAFEAAKAGGADDHEALAAVVDFLIEETVRGLD
jgi:carboxylate-amine ligase